MSRHWDGFWSRIETFRGGLRSRLPLLESRRASLSKVVPHGPQVQDSRSVLGAGVFKVYSGMGERELLSSTCCVLLGCSQWLCHSYLCERRTAVRDELWTFYVCVGMFYLQLLCSLNSRRWGLNCCQRWREWCVSTGFFVWVMLNVRVQTNVCF